MPLVIEDGSGVTSAVAYVQAATATTLLTARGLAPSAWAALSVSEQEAFIVRGADLLNDMRRHPWKGSLRVQGQTMQWPRDGIAFPLVLPLCNALYAVSMFNGVSYDAVSSALGNITSVSIASLSVSFDPRGSAPDVDPTATPLVRNPTVDGLLFPYVMLPRDAEIGSAGGVVFMPMQTGVPASPTVSPEYEV